MLLLGKSPDGVECGELAAFCVHPSYRGSGRGDSLLDYVEQDARLNGIRRLVLLTTRTADWFEQRDFKQDTLAHLRQAICFCTQLFVSPCSDDCTVPSHVYSLERCQL